MTTTFRQLVRIIAFALVAVTACAAHAQATRTWVSGVGDDANPCSRTAPCKTFAGAISKTAAGGIINVLDPGGFGAVTITKAMTIDGSGGGGIASIVATGTNGIVVNAGPTDLVVLRNLHLDGQGTSVSTSAGVLYNNAGSLVVENTNIHRFGVGIDVSGAIANARLDVRHTTITASNIGLRNASAGSTAMLTDVVVRSNGTGISAQGGEIGMLRCAVVNNTTGLVRSGGQLLTFGDNYFFGNASDGSVRLQNQKVF